MSLQHFDEFAEHARLIYAEYQRRLGALPPRHAEEVSLLQGAQTLTGAITPLLAGKHPGVVGAVLADLTAMWLACHSVADDAEATDAMRGELMHLQWAAVRQLTAVNEADLLARARGAYRDDSRPARTCDACGKPYHGPAVYCSLECAMGDA